MTLKNIVLLGYCDISHNIFREDILLLKIVIMP